MVPEESFESLSILDEILSSSVSSSFGLNPNLENQIAPIPAMRKMAMTATPNPKLTPASGATPTDEKKPDTNQSAIRKQIPTTVVR